MKARHFPQSELDKSLALAKEVATLHVDGRYADAVMVLAVEFEVLAMAVKYAKDSVTDVEAELIRHSFKANSAARKDLTCALSWLKGV